jgi:transposase-like protein
MTDKKTSGSNPPRVYSETFKRKVIEEYLRTGEPKLHIQKKYSISFKSAICTWMKRLGYKDIHEKLPYFEVANQIELATVAKNKSNRKGQDQAELEKRIKELERQLEDEKLRSEAYRLMIDIAEKELKIPIRKKPNTK